MKVLVTGANGFIGAHVVRAFLARGHDVRAMVRPSARLDHQPWAGEVEVARADLRVVHGLAEACRGVDAVVHIAARMGGSEAQQFETTVCGTERLLEAVRDAAIPRVVLASSFAVYDWSAIRRTLDEQSPVVRDDIARRGPYTVAKVWQERLARRASAEAAFALTVLRPGFVWGRDHMALPGMAQRYGTTYVVFGRRTLLPLTYVENCAEAFVEATLNDEARSETFNVIDDAPITAWRYTREYLQRAAQPGHVISVPFPLALGISRLGAAVGRRLFAGGGDLPNLFVPGKLEAQFKPLRFPNDKIRERLGWRPRWSFEEGLQRSHGPDAASGIRQERLAQELR